MLSGSLKFRATGFAEQRFVIPETHNGCSFSRGRLERFGKPRKEFGEAERPQGRASGRERVHVRMRESQKTNFISLLGIDRLHQELIGNLSMVVEIPEPADIVLTGIGAAFLVGWRCLKRKSSWVFPNYQSIFPQPYRNLVPCRPFLRRERGFLFSFNSQAHAVASNKQPLTTWPDEEGPDH